MTEVRLEQGFADVLPANGTVRVTASTMPMIGCRFVKIAA